MKILTIKQIIIDYWQQAIKPNLLWILLLSALVSGYFVYVAWKTPKTYAARLTFMINQEQGGSGGAIGALMGNLGIAGGGGGDQNLYKIAALATSNKILGMLMKQKNCISSKCDYIGNTLVKELSLDEKWESDSFLQGFKFDSTEHKYEKRAVKEIAKILRGDPDNGIEGMLSLGHNKNTQILYISSISSKEELSIVMANHLFEVISTYYVNKTIERQEATHTYMKEYADSLKRELKSAEYRLARFVDKGNSILQYTKKLPLEQLKNKVEMLYIMYGEALKNQEASAYMLKSATPYFQLIDEPAGPLRLRGKSRSKGLIQGGFIGLILGIVLFCGLHFLKLKIAKEQAEL